MFVILDYLKIGAGVAAGLVLDHRYAVTIGYPSAAREARAGYVLLSEKTAVEATAKEMERQRNAAQQATEEHRRRLEAAQAEQAKTEATLETEIKTYELQLSEKNRRCLADSADVEWLLHH